MTTTHIAGAAALLAAALVAGGGAVPAQAAGGYRPARAVDGDTVQLANGRYVRLLGYDTPEVGQCGYTQAKNLMARLVRDGVKLQHRSGTDRYGRILAYLHTRDGRDVGTVVLRKGWAVARYDSRDGYDWHPKEATYHRLDARNGTITC